MDKENGLLSFLGEDGTDYSRDEYCNKACEYYKYCYANHELCIKQTFKDVFSNILSSREGKIIKMFYGWNGNRRYSFEEIGNAFNLTSERIRQINAKAIRKLRHQEVLNEFLYEVYSLQDKSFYYELMTDVFGAPKDTLQFALHTGVDVSVIDIDKHATKTITEIKSELNKKIEDIEILKPFCKTLKNIITLNQLLHTSKSKLLFDILKDDVLYFDMVSLLSSIGYKIKGDRNAEMLELTFTEKLKSLVVDCDVYKKTLEELPLTTNILLFENGILTIGDLLLKFNDICIKDVFDIEVKKQIEDFLISKGFVVIYNERKIRLIDNFWNCYLKRLVVWLIENSFSIISLISQLEKLNGIKNNLFLDFINKQYPQFEFSYYDEMIIDKDMPIDILELSVRSFNYLKRSGLDTINDVVTFLESGGIVRNLGRKGIEEVIAKLSQLGIELNFSNEPQCFL